MMSAGSPSSARVGRIEHGRVQEAVDHQRAAGLVDLVFHRFAALRDLDDGVQVIRRVHADGDL
jgi:hypothetical protein